MRKIIYILITLLFITSNFACESDSNASNINDSGNNNSGEVSYILTTKTIYIPQSIDGVIQNCPVIIQAANEIDPTINYPIVFAFHG